MNPQYIPAQFGAPPAASFPGQPGQPPMPGQQQQGFQNVPLDGPKPGLPPPQNIPAPLSNNGVPPPGPFPPQSHALPPTGMRPIPTSQLPPMADQQRPPSRPPSNTQFGPPPVSKPSDPFQNGLNGQFTNSGFPPTSQQSKPQVPSPGLGGQPPMPGKPPGPQPSFGQPPLQGPPQNLGGPGLPPNLGPPGQPQNLGGSGLPPNLGPPGQPQNLAGSGLPPNLGAPGQPQNLGGPGLPPNLGAPGQPPLPGQPANLGGPGQPSLPGPPNLGAPGQPPLSGLGQQAPLGGPGQPPLLGQQPPLGGLGQPPLPGQQPSLGGPPKPGQPPLPALGGPGLQSNIGNPGQPPLPGQQPNLGGPPGQLPFGAPGQQQPPLGGQLPGQQQPPFGGPGQQPPLAGPPKPGQPPLPGQQPQLGGPGPQSFGPPGQQPPSSFNQPPFPGQNNQPPLPGQGRPGQMPPIPNKAPYGQFPGQQPPQPQQQQYPGQFPGQPQQKQFPGQPPLPGQQYNPGQLNNQMQDLSLGGQRQQYPGMRNGDQPPHMPPMPQQQPQQQYLNGQQLRGPQQPGYPPMPGQGGMPPGPGYYQQQPYAQEQPKQKLDPDLMPNPIQVIQDDQENRSGVFHTNQRGQVPPLVTTKFVVQDEGNSSPRFIRSTMYNVPITQDIMKNTAVPFSLVISPMARTAEGEHPPPIVNFGELGPVRCIRCKAYMCPYMQFIDSGRRFQCLFCKATTDVPNEYFQHLDHTGQRMDRFERPELVLGTYEFVATADYCRNNVLPKPPAIIFVIDVSYNNVKSGLVNLLCAQMKEIIQNLPVDQGHEKSNMKVGFITYNSSVHFYNIKGTLAAPQMMIVGDTADMFMPLLDGFLCTPEESESVIDALMEQIPEMFATTRETETVLLPAILAGLEALKASECTGKLVVFHSSLPTAEAPGKLKNREDRKLLGTDKERTVLTPQSQAYNQLGQDCVAAGGSVDLFIFNNSYIDIATIGQVSRLTGGEVFKYTYFQADIDGERLVQDVIINISRPIAFDAIMRVRTSTGVRPTDFYGHFFMSNTTDMELAAIDCDKAVAVEIKHDDKLTEEEGVYIQAALLFTSCSGQRRLRIINLSLKTVSQMADLFRSCDLDTIMNYIAKQAAFKLLDNSPKAVKDAIAHRAAQILATYRKNCASPSNAGQLILPECMKLLPLYINCLLKNDSISGGADMTIDDRSFVMQALMTMNLQTSVDYFYPRLIPLHNIEPSAEVRVPQQVRCSVAKLTDDGVYILENGIHMFLWVGLGVNPEFVQKVFGAASSIQINIDTTALPVLDNPLSLAVRNIVDEIRTQKHRYMKLTLVRQREKLEHVFKHFLVEDQGSDGSPSYVDFLCHMHKEIRLLLS